MKEHYYVLLSFMFVLVIFGLWNFIYSIQLNSFFLKVYSFQLKAKEIEMMEELMDKNEYCKVGKSLINNVILFYESLLKEVNKIEDKERRGKYTLLLREYYLSSVKLYKVLTEYKKRCGAKYHLILFFFKEGNSPKTKVQSNVLLKLKRKYPNAIYVFAIPVGRGYAFFDYLAWKYGVKEFPTVVADGRVYSFFKEEDLNVLEGSKS